MCLAIPGQIEEIYLENQLRMAKVNFGGVRRAVCIDYAPEAGVGDYVLVHVGFAISIIDEGEAARTLAGLTEQEFIELQPDEDQVI